MFKFHCYKCNECFRIELSNLPEKENLNCPNCNNEVPIEAIKHLNQIGDSYNALISILSIQPKWGLSIDELSEPRPSKRSKMKYINTEI